ncbi:hypothetical protein EDC04DRAFT_2618446 [Pisolithus marmoratus]|nr:hypothetical protein EDC04DRAFT_2618446 [Pisolithus marmoratus]
MHPALEPIQAPALPQVSFWAGKPLRASAQIYRTKSKVVEVTWACEARSGVACGRKEHALTSEAHAQPTYLLPLLFPYMVYSLNSMPLLVDCAHLLDYLFRVRGQITLDQYCQSRYKDAATYINVHFSSPSTGLDQELSPREGLHWNIWLVPVISASRFSGRVITAIKERNLMQTLHLDEAARVIHMLADVRPPRSEPPRISKFCSVQ